MSKAQIEFLQRCKAFNLHSGSLNDWLDRIEQLESDVAALNKATDLAIEINNDQVGQIERLEAERDELKADAMRYRWLMNDDGHNALMATLASLCATDDPIKPQMDAAIDAAIAKVRTA